MPNIGRNGIHNRRCLKSAYEKHSDMQRLAGPFGKAVHFPTGLEAVDKLIENEAYLAIAKQLLGHGRNSARLWADLLSRRSHR